MKHDSDHMQLLPSAIEDGAFAEDLGKLTLEWDAPGAPVPFAILDFHDQTLRLSGQVLIEAEKTLALLADDAQPLVQSADRRGNFAKDLAEGPVKQALGRFSDLRSLMEIVSGQAHKRSATLLDDERKTRARLTLWTLTRGERTVTLATISTLRGYKKAGRLLGSCLDEAGARDFACKDLFDVLAPDATPYIAKPEIRLTRTERAFDVANDIIATYLAVARQNEAGIIADIDTEFLHDYRVSLRRNRSVVSLFKGVYSADETARLKTALSDLMDPTGRLRDLDVYLLERQTYFDLLPEALHPGLTVMFDAFAADRARAHADMVKHLQSAAYQREIGGLIARFAAPETLEPGDNADLPAHDYAQALIWKRYRKVTRIAAAIDADTPDDDVHELRIHCKKLRYLMEFFAPLFPKKEYKPILKPLKGLQDNLGLFNDYSVQQIALQDFMNTHTTGNRARDLSVAQSIGALIAVLHQRQLDERARVVESFHHFDSKQVRTAFRKLHKPHEE